MSKDNVYSRLADVIRAVGAVEKTGKAYEGYKHHSIDDVVDRLRPALLEHGLVYTVDIDAMEFGSSLETNRQGKERTVNTAHCVGKLQVISTDDPEQRITVGIRGQGIDYSDKAGGKAVSYALKTALLALFQMRGHPDNEQDEIKAPARSKTRRPVDPLDKQLEYYQSHPDLQDDLKALCQKARLPQSKLSDEKKQKLLEKCAEKASEAAELTSDEIPF